MPLLNKRQLRIANLDYNAVYEDYKNHHMEYLTKKYGITSQNILKRIKEKGYLIKSKGREKSISKLLPPISECEKELLKELEKEEQQAMEIKKQWKRIYPQFFSEKGSN